MKKLGLYVGTMLVPLFTTLPNITTASSSSSDILSDLSETEGPENLPTNLISDVIWVFVALGIVIALLVIALKWLSKRNKAWGAQKGMRSLGGISLGQQASLQVVELGGRIYIVGVGDQVTLIDKEEDPVKVAELLQAIEHNDQNNMGFSSIKEWLAAKKSTGTNKDDMTATDQGMWKHSDSFEHMLQSKLDKQAERKQELETLLKENKK